MSAVDWMRGPVLVFGAEGMLGRELMALFRLRLGDGADQRLVGWDIADLDIRDRDAVLRSLERLKPSAVVNAAAYTDVDGCEMNIELAMDVNGKAPAHIAQGCSEIGAILVHFSTDFIFDGRSDRPYSPEDEANPLSVYGRSKWEGEQAVRASGCCHLIVRTLWLFGPHGHNFVEAILSRTKAGEPLRVVTDEIGSPTLAADLAEAVVRLLDAGAQGTVHFANLGHCSWFEFAQEIVRQAGLATPVQPITSNQLGRPARRPCYSVLDSTTYIELTGHRPQLWQDALTVYFERCGAQRGMAADSSTEPAAPGCRE